MLFRVQGVLIKETERAAQRARLQFLTLLLYLPTRFTMSCLQCEL